MQEAQQGSSITCFHCFMLLHTILCFARILYKYNKMQACTKPKVCQNRVRLDTEVHLITKVESD